MAPPVGVSPTLRDHAAARPAYEPFVAQVVEGLRASPKRISSKFLYDARGSALFDQICELPEYYPTRTEIQILEARGEDIARRIGEQALLVEFGSGSSLKTRLLLDLLPTLAGYVPVDISRSHLMTAAQGIAAAYPRLEVLPVCADFTQPFSVPTPRRRPAKLVVFFPGSTIGNFDAPQAVELLQVMRDVAGPGGGLLIGADLVKDVNVLVRAYDDDAGITATFNRNLLHRLNSELGADFDVASFRHRAVWNGTASRIEMHLVSIRDQAVRLDGERITFAAGEAIVTEHCHKYTLTTFAWLAGLGGWQMRERWLDDRGYFSVNYAETA